MLRPELLKVFPAALLGRIVSIPYFPLSDEMLGGIVRLQLDRMAVGYAIITTRPSAMTTRSWSTSCQAGNDPDSGGRMIDNIITNTLLPELSREFLRKSLAKEEIKQTHVSIANEKFAYSWN